MKTSTLLLLGAAAAAAFYFSTRSATASPAEEWGASGSFAPFEASSINQAGDVLTRKITTSAEGVSFINDAIANRQAIQPTTTTLARNVTLVTPGGSSTGNVVKFQTGGTYHVSVNPVAKVGPLGTKTDYQIARNVAVNQAKAARRGWIGARYHAGTKAVY